jgi:hypothetical protein
MDINENRRPGVVSRSGGEYVSSNSANVVDFPSNFNAASLFRQLTARMVLAQYRTGALPESVIVALLVGAGLSP